MIHLPTRSTSPKIAEQLRIPVNTVEQHLETIGRKLGSAADAKQ